MGKMSEVGQKVTDFQIQNKFCGYDVHDDYS